MLENHEELETRKCIWVDKYLGQTKKLLVKSKQSLKSREVYKMERGEKKSNTRYQRMLPLKAKNVETNKKSNKIRTGQSLNPLNSLNIALSPEANYIHSSSRNNV